MASELGVQTIQHTNGTDALTVASDGSVEAQGKLTMHGLDHVPAFFARVSNDTAIAANTNPIIFNETEANVGSHYSTTTGKFTAPVAGTYMFIVKGHEQTQDNVGRSTFIRVNNTKTFYGYSLSSSTGRATIVVNAIITLAKDDEITVSLEDGDSWGGNDAGLNFMGYLIG